MSQNCELCVQQKRVIFYFLKSFTFYYLAYIYSLSKIFLVLGFSSAGIVVHTSADKMLSQSCNRLSWLLVSF